MIRFLQPLWLLALLPVFAVAGVYVWRQFRRRQYAMRFTNVDLLRTLAPKGLGWRRHAAAGAFLLCLVALGSAMARPSVDKEEPLERATVMLAIDVSLSMEAADVAPTRMQAAQEAAKQFVAELPPTYNLGLVSFAKSANVLVSPTKDRNAVIAGIDGLSLAEATATGEAVFTSLDAIRTVPADGAAGAPPARIVLLSDGANTSGRDPDEAAGEANTMNVPVDTISFGTTAGEIARRGGVAMSVPVDGDTLRGVAEKTNGGYHEADSKEELQAVYSDIGSSVGYVKERADVSARFIGLALLIAMAAALASMFWFSRIP
jgi:Ca-activated chloride channel homolog